DSGIPVRLSKIAELKDGFGETPVECWFNGHPAIQIDVFAVGNESPLSVEAAVQEYLESHSQKRFEGVNIEIFENQAAAYRSRMTLLLENAVLGLILVLVTLGLFLSPNVAFWVMAGIPTSLLGGILLLPLFGGTINMLSLFAFIVTIGVVVDDAIMIGEAVYMNRQKGMTNFEASVQGLKEMGGPVLLATMTTMIAFTPMFFVPGEMGVLFYQIPAVVLAVLLVSLLESLFILAAHISTDESDSPWLKFLTRPQKAVNQRLEKFIDQKFRPFIESTLKKSASLYVSAISVLLITIALIAGDWVEFEFTPTIESDMIIAQAALPYGSPKQKSIDIQKRFVDSANQILKENNMTSPGLFSLIGLRLEEGEVEVETLSGYHYISVLMALPKEEERTISGREFADKWRKAFGDIEELEAFNITAETNVTGGEPIMLEVFHPKPEIARKAAIFLGDRMRMLSGLTSIDDGVRAGKPELNLKIKDLGIQMGITSEMIAQQVRHRYHGIEALRFIKGNNEVKVMVRLPENERNGAGSLYDAIIQSPSGAFVPLAEIADIDQKQSFTSLARRNGKRIYPVTADIGFGIDDDIFEDALEDVLVPQVIEEYPGVKVNFGGEEEEDDESLAYLGNGFLIVLGIIFLMLVFYYNSCTQALIVLTAIPFSLVGAVWGHICLGHDISIVSISGIIAIAGVVVYDSLVLVTTYNRSRASGQTIIDSIVDAACHRFRPILLTTLTTFFGLVPLLLETSEQAQFLIPAAISISFGLIFGTLITLILIPGLLWLFEKEEKEPLTLALKIINSDKGLF
ncbi:MAG: efflux RND transporter permease subunit, partial [Desulfobacterales bacterium]|nr:efflux RND transporter permease subunit [Desulfobacterales bacterium]